MEQDELRKLEEKCIQDCAPTCTAACPVHVDVKAMLTQVGKGDFTAALAIFKKTVPFPGVICRICDQPCQDVCKYGEIGDAIAIRGMERAAVEMGDPTAEKSRPLPKRNGRVAIIGGGICGLTAAHDLARKGYTVAILEAGDRLGGSLWKADRDYLPGAVIEQDLEIIEKLGIEVQLHTPVNRDLADVRREYDAVYIAVGPYTDESFDLTLDSGGFIKVDPVIFSTSMEGVFAGGGLLWGMEMHSSVTSISEGRRAGISIDRYLQRVSLTASRVNEGPYTSCLYTSLEGVTPHPLIEPSEPLEGYQWHEAMQEAKRCLQCECMECVKVCEYLKHYERYPRRYLREIYNNLAIVKGTRYANQLINSCSLCGLCAEVCPESLDMGEVALKARRAMVEQNRMPPSAHDFALRDMQFSNGEHAALVRNAPGATASDFVLFPG
ncbi:MAG: FAD-dependent oxidoreductase, partial [Anaerolineae bacterium]|nr:FAD-dependent oxidoreductase [Anaerolineae bacterium]